MKKEKVEEKEKENNKSVEIKNNFNIDNNTKYIEDLIKKYPKWGKEYKKRLSIK
tara:strand:- start:142 stop:303 length:162 start_codon:yes stop_codon:yes gene_type:complete